MTFSSTAVIFWSVIVLLWVAVCVLMCKNDKIDKE